MEDTSFNMLRNGYDVLSFPSSSPDYWSPGKTGSFPLGPYDFERYTVTSLYKGFPPLLSNPQGQVIGYYNKDYKAFVGITPQLAHRVKKELCLPVSPIFNPPGLRKTKPLCNRFQAICFGIIILGYLIF